MTTLGELLGEIYAKDNSFAIVEIAFKQEVTLSNRTADESKRISVTDTFSRAIERVWRILYENNTVTTTGGE